MLSINLVVNFTRFSEEGEAEPEINRRIMRWI